MACTLICSQAHICLLHKNVWSESDLIAVLQSCSQSRKESEVLGGVGVGFLTTLGVRVDLFVKLQMSNWIIFKITLLNWEYLFKWYSFFWNFCWSRDFLLCTTISIDLTAKFHSLYVKESESERPESEISESWKSCKGRSQIFHSITLHHTPVLLGRLWSGLNIAHYLMQSESCAS